jgi:hypothetical protein
MENKIRVFLGNLTNQRATAAAADKWETVLGRGQGCGGLFFELAQPHPVPRMDLN